MVLPSPIRAIPRIIRKHPFESFQIIHANPLDIFLCWIDIEKGAIIPFLPPLFFGANIFFFLAENNRIIIEKLFLFFLVFVGQCFFSNLFRAICSAKKCPDSCLAKAWINLCTFFHWTLPCWINARFACLPMVVRYESIRICVPWVRILNAGKCGKKSLPRIKHRNI